MAASTEGLTCSEKGKAELEAVLAHFGPKFKEVGVAGGRRRHSRRRSHRRGGGVFGDIVGALCGLAAAPFKQAAENVSGAIDKIKTKLNDTLTDDDKRMNFITAVNRILVAGVGTMALRDLATDNSKITAVTLALLEGIQSFIPEAFSTSEMITLGTNLTSIGLGAAKLGGAFFLGAASVWGMHMVYTKALVPAAKGVAAVASEAVTPEGFGRLVDGLVYDPRVSRVINRSIKVALETQGPLTIEDMPVLEPPVIHTTTHTRLPASSYTLSSAPTLPVKPPDSRPGGRRTRKHRRHHARKHTFRRKH